MSRVVRGRGAAMLRGEGPGAARQTGECEELLNSCYLKRSAGDREKAERTLQEVSGSSGARLVLKNKICAHQKKKKKENTYPVKLNHKTQPYFTTAKNNRFLSEVLQ